MSDEFVYFFEFEVLGGCDHIYSFLIADCYCIYIYYGYTGSSADSTSSTADNNPLWKYVTKLEKNGDGGGNWKWLCNFCNQEK